MSKSKMNSALAIGVLGVLVLIGSDTYAAEPVSKRKPATAAATSIKFGKPPQRLGVKAPQAAPQAGGELARWNYVNGWPQSAPQAGRDTVATYNFTQAWPPSAPAAKPAPKQTGNHGKVVLLTMSLPGALPEAQQSGAYRPGAYQVISAGDDGGTAASASHPNWIDVESRSWGISSAVGPSTGTLDTAGLAAEPRNAIPVEGVTIGVEPIQRVSASATPSAAQGGEIQQIDVNQAMKRFDKAQ